MTSHGGISIAESYGPGPAIVFLHGNSMRKESFFRQWQALAGTRHLLALDFPGHGESSNADNPERTYTLQGYAACVSEVLVATGVEHGVLVGWSLGGHVALEVVTQSPGVAGVLAFGTPPFQLTEDGAMLGFKPNPKLALAGSGRLSDDEIEDFAILVSGEQNPDEAIREAIARTDTLARPTLIGSLADYPAQRQMELAIDSPAPLAMVNGANDPFVDLAYVAGLPYRNLWSGRAHSLAGIGHSPHIQASGQFNALLLRFLDEIAPLD